MIDFFEEIEKAENDDQYYFYSDAERIDTAVLCSEEFKERKGHEKRESDQHNVFEPSFTEIEKDENGEGQKLNYCKGAEQYINEVVLLACVIQKLECDIIQKSVSRVK
ncbi:hypothetical protein HHL16_17430 [Pseudoflavitalea sp. G-6-1-2]|uniref:hypothetical protein n=1 Tax=Pseudoflavitalea sp. G-6-1-2 TaxID=2728841 RepID=UPI00146A267B|nr:hypothetical protein [Pseudoflavitalea sp. G-6-1-2]NML22669.1 hypothetical protein [Pseudoflavitalea sp. G-6-1-2]